MHIFRLATTFTGVIFATLIVLSFSLPQAEAANLITINIQTQALDLDSGIVFDLADEPDVEPTGADIMMAYHADRTPHAVVRPAAKGVAIAFIDNIAYDGVSAAEVEGLSFSVQALDVALGAGDTVIVLTDNGAVFKLGNSVESTTAVTFNYEQIQ